MKTLTALGSLIGRIVDPADPRHAWKLPKFSRRSHTLTRKDDVSMTSPTLKRLFGKLATAEQSSDGRTYVSAAPRKVHYMDRANGRLVPREAEVTKPMRRLDLLMVPGLNRAQRKEVLIYARKAGLLSGVAA
jgi:hypothetical protein